MKDGQYVVAIGKAEHRMMDRGSRFIGYAVPASDEMQAVEILDGRRRQHHNATHHCWGFRVGDPKDPLERSSDDGEPSGTAGRPILEQIRKANLIGVIVIVSRWFGGTKLGRGGLIRAYGGCAAETIALIRTEIRIPMMTFTIICDYDIIGTVEHIIAQRNGRIESADYSDNVQFTVTIPLLQSRSFHEQIAEVGYGKLKITSQQ